MSDSDMSQIPPLAPKSSTPSLQDRPIWGLIRELSVKDFSWLLGIAAAIAVGGFIVGSRVGAYASDQSINTIRKESSDTDTKLHMYRIKAEFLDRLQAAKAPATDDNINALGAEVCSVLNDVKRTKLPDGSEPPLSIKVVGGVIIITFKDGAIYRLSHEMTAKTLAQCSVP